MGSWGPASPLAPGDAGRCVALGRPRGQRLARAPGVPGPQLQVKADCGRAIPLVSPQPRVKFAHLSSQGTKFLRVSEDAGVRRGGERLHPAGWAAGGMGAASWSLGQGNKC